MTHQKTLVHLLLLLYVGTLFQFSSTQSETDGATSEDRTPCVSVDDVDKVVDSFVGSIRQTLPDPMDLPDKNRALLVVTFLNGKLRGLSTLYRTGPADVTCSESDTVYDVPLGVKTISASYTWKVATLVKDFWGGVNITAETFRAEARFRTYTSAGTDPERTELEKLQLVELKNVSFKVSGLGTAISWALSQVASVVVNVFHGALADCLEGPIKDLINDGLKNAELSEQSL